MFLKWLCKTIVFLECLKYSDNNFVFVLVISCCVFVKPVVFKGSLVYPVCVER